MEEILDKLPIGIYRTNFETGKFISASGPCLEMLGFKNFSELKNYSSADFYVNPEDREKMKKRIKNNPIKNYIVQLKDKNGNAFWARLTGKLNDNFIDGSICDISELKLEEVKELETLKSISKAAKTRTKELLNSVNV